MRWVWIASLAVLLLACSDDTEGSGGGGETAAGGAGAGGSGGAPVMITGPDPAFLPVPTGVCPAFTDGTVMFAPAGIPPRNVQLYLDPATLATPGPLIFYWHGNGSSPIQEPPYGLNPELGNIKAAGGMVVAPHSDNTGQFSWHLTTGAGPLDDLIVADEVLACALEAGFVDSNHIHSMGLSAGALNTVQMAYRRSGYIASAAIYSGGAVGGPPDNQDPTNLFPLFMFHGGPTDIVLLNFQDLTEGLHSELLATGHFSIICNHNQGHTIPVGQGEQTSIWRFLQEHPFGTNPSPYAAGLPEGFPPYCTL
jgi:hypothetical protein